MFIMKMDSVAIISILVFLVAYTYAKESGVTHVQTKVNGSAAFLIDDITCHKHDLYDTNGTKMFEINKYGKSIMPAWIDRLTWKTPTLTINHVQQEDAGFYSINKTDSSLNGPICDKRGFQLEVIVSDCGSPTAPEHGTVTLVGTETTFQATATQSCDTGYNRSPGSGTITCLETGSWSASFTCSIVDCGSPTAPEHGTVTLVGTETTFQATATQSCDTGYNRSPGSGTITCLESGSWSVSFTCSIVDCGSPTAPEHGTVTLVGTKTTFQATATQSCDTGYNCSPGSETITCLATGLWSASLVCSIVDCGSPKAPEHGTVTLVGTETTFQATATQSCDTGYNRSPGSGTITCLETGSWSVSFTCSIVDCGSPTAPEHGTVTLVGTETTFQVTATQFCDTGYNRSPGSGTITCLATGLWSASLVCSIVDCGSPTAPEHGTVTFLGTETTFQASATQSCDTGYNRSPGSGTITCLETGSWSMSFTCSIVDCGSTMAPEHGTVTLVGTETTFQATAIQSCDRGHYRSPGSGTITCLATGLWSASSVCSMVGFNKSVQKEVFVGTQANIIILDLMKYFQDRMASEFNARITGETSSTTDCSSNYVVGSDMKLRLLRSPTRPSGNTTCELPIDIWETNQTVHVLFVTIQYSGCLPETDDRGVPWEATMPNTTVVKTCPEPSAGFITRTCDTRGMFLDPVNNCTRSSVGKILDKLYDQLNQTNVDKTIVAEVLNELSKETVSDQNGLNATDANFTVNALKYLTENKFSRTIKDKAVYRLIFDTANNLFDVNNTQAWQTLMEKDKAGAEQLMAVIDKTMEHEFTMVTDDDSDEGDNQPIIYQRENLMLSMGSTSRCNYTMVFPNRNSDVIDWTKNSRNSVRTPCINMEGSSAFSSIYYRNISKLISWKTQSHDRIVEINSGVMTYTLYPIKKEKLQKNIELHFELYNTKMRKPLCSFWSVNESSKSPGYWSTRGCRLKSFKDDLVVCSCDHLTNFAILMSPVHVETPDEHVKILGILTVVGCIMSMVSLMVTVVIHAIFWRHVAAKNSDGPVILLNLCGSLFTAYLVFLIGVSKTENKIGCTVVAALLHYLFLVVFFTMLAEGALLVKMVVWPLKASIRIAWKLLIGIWALPAGIVAVSLWVSRTEGYGDDKFCWLTVDSGLLWSFVGPALAVIAVNGVIIVVVLRMVLGTAAMKNQSESRKIKKAVRSLAILLPLVGITWLLGVFSINEDLLAFQYIFVILNTLQGLAIFIWHCALNKTVRSALKRMKEKLLVSRSLSDKPKEPSESGNSWGWFKAKWSRTQTTESTELSIQQEQQPLRSTN